MSDQELRQVVSGLRLLFENLAESHLTRKRVQRLRNWIAKASQARGVYSLKVEANQYDKAEEIITFYTFAPLALREDKKDVVQEILQLASTNESVQEPVNLSFEKQLGTPEGCLTWLTKEVGKHPVRYIREQGKDARLARPLETDTHVDTIVETENLLILIEMKFTSDIPPQTTYNPLGNQLARTIDVGISDAEKKDKGLIVLSCSPTEFYLRKCRLYYYKIQEYADLDKIKEDICWRGHEEIQRHVLSVAWIPLEKVIEKTYGGFRSHDVTEAAEFFKERNLTS